MPMIDIDKILAEVEELRGLVAAKAEARAAYGLAHKAFIEAADATDKVMLGRLDSIEEELGVQPPPGDLPKASLHDAADTPRGGTMVFRLVLDKPGAEEITVDLKIDDVTFQCMLPPGETRLDLPVEIADDAPLGTVTAKVTASDATKITIVDGEAVGKVVDVPTSGGLPAGGGAVTSPIVIPAGSWRELRTFAAVVKLDSAPTVHVKVAGGDSTQNDYGGWVLERHGAGQMQAWVYVNGAAQTARSTGQLPLGESVFVATRIFPDRIVLNMGSLTFSKVFTGSIVAFDGPSVVGDGYWRHVLSGEWPGEITAWKALQVALSDADLATLAAELLGA